MVAILGVWKIVESPKPQCGIYCLYTDSVIYVECNEHLLLTPKRLELLKTKRRNGIIVMFMT